MWGRESITAAPDPICIWSLRLLENTLQPNYKTGTWKEEQKLAFMRNITTNHKIPKKVTPQGFVSCSSTDGMNTRAWCCFWVFGLKGLAVAPACCHTPSGLTGSWVMGQARKG